MEYRSKHFADAYERGRGDGRRGVRYDAMRDWVEKPRLRRAYGVGFALGKTEEILGRCVNGEDV